MTTLPTNYADGNIVDASDIDAITTQINTNTTNIGTLTAEQVTNSYLQNLTNISQPSSQFCTLPRIASNTVATATGELNLTYFQAPNAMTINNIGTVSGGTAAATVTTAQLGIYSVNASNGNLTLAGSTANTTTLWAATNTAYTTALTSATSLTAGVWYAVGILIVATTAPSLVGSTVLDDANLTPRLCGLLTSQTSLASPITGSSVNHNTRVFYTRLY